MILLLIMYITLVDISEVIDWICIDRYKTEQQYIGVNWAEHPILANDHLKTNIAKALLESSVKYDIDPMLILATMWRESYLDNKVASLEKLGAKGEKGLMQILPKGVCDKNCDFSTIGGQVDCGAKCLKSNIVACNGNISYGLSRYRSGGKCMETKAGKRRYRLYKLLKKVLKYGKEENH